MNRNLFPCTNNKENENCTKQRNNKTIKNLKKTDKPIKLSIKNIINNLKS